MCVLLSMLRLACVGPLVILYNNIVSCCFLSATQQAVLLQGTVSVQALGKVGAVAQTSVITHPCTLYSTTPRASPALKGMAGVRGIGTFKLPTLFPAGWDSEASQAI